MEQTAQVNLRNIESGKTCAALISFGWDGRNAYLSVEVPGASISAQVADQDAYYARWLDSLRS